MISSQWGAGAAPQARGERGYQYTQPRERLTFLQMFALIFDYKDQISAAYNLYFSQSSRRYLYISHNSDMMSEKIVLS